MMPGILISFDLITCTCLQQEINLPADDGLKDRAVAELRHVLNTGQGWEKVHAAEFLLESGYKENVYSVFYSEWNKNGHVPQYRIGIWRVLYRCAGTEEKHTWSDLIHNAFTDESSPDRIHAVETLAKLKIPVKDSDSIPICSALQSGNPSLWFYTQWWVIPSKKNGTEELKRFLLQMIHSEENTPLLRQLAKYVLQTDTTVSLTVEGCITLHEHEALLFEREPYQWCLASAGKKDTADLEKLSLLLKHQETDVRSAAAYAIIKILSK
ncbi:MAG: hypothetical protein LBL57_01070 [Tannerella sp.]|jgi:hypothetical protein|nr:hypothetical protein [Tannerella sp.]